MAMVQPLNTVQIQQPFDAWADEFLGMVERAKQMVAQSADWTAAMATANPPLLVGLDNAGMAEPVRANLIAKYAALQNFITWAETGGANSPVNYLRANKRTVV